MRPDVVVSANFVAPSSVYLQFEDGKSGVWEFHELGLDMTNMKLSTIRPSRSGTSVNVQNKWNDNVELDSSSLRASVDTDYAAKLEKEFLALRGPLESITTNSVSLPHKK